MVCFYFFYTGIDVKTISIYSHISFIRTFVFPLKSCKLTNRAGCWIMLYVFWFIIHKFWYMCTCIFYEIFRNVHIKQGILIIICILHNYHINLIFWEKNPHYLQETTILINTEGKIINLSCVQWKKGCNVSLLNMRHTFLQVPCLFQTVIVGWVSLSV